MNSRTCTSVLAVLAAGTALVAFYLPVPAAADDHCDFHMNVRDSFTLAGGWQAFTGLIDNGELHVGDAIRITQPDGARTVRQVGRIGVRGQDRQSAGRGDIVAVFIADADNDGLGDATGLDGHCGAPPATTAAMPETAPPAELDLPTEWFGGLRMTTSPDGKEFQGAVEALVERVYDQPNGIIRETLLEDGRLVAVTLRQSDQPNVFFLHREDGAYTGTVTFAPDAWNATSWTYDLARADGTRIKGTGTDNGMALLIEQYLVGSDGERRTRFTERLPRIQQTTYDTKRNALVR